MIDAGQLIALLREDCLIQKDVPTVTKRKKPSALCYCPVFLLEFWFRLLQKFGMQSLAPQLAETSFDDWWEKILGETEEQTKQGLNSVVILGAWTLWKHRNNCVFDGVPPNLIRALQLAGEELHFLGFGRG